MGFVFRATDGVCRTFVAEVTHVKVREEPRHQSYERGDRPGGRGRGEVELSDRDYIRTLHEMERNDPLFADDLCKQYTVLIRVEGLGWRESPTHFIACVP